MLTTYSAALYVFGWCCCDAIILFLFFFFDDEESQRSRFSFGWHQTGRKILVPPVTVVTTIIIVALSLSFSSKETGSIVNDWLGRCDQMVRIFFNIWPFATMKIRPIMSQISQSMRSILPKTSAKMAKFCQIGHTGLGARLMQQNYQLYHTWFSFSNKNGRFPASFSFIVFSTVNCACFHYKFSPMIGFERRTSGIGSNHSASELHHQNCSLFDCTLLGRTYPGR